MSASIAPASIAAAAAIRLRRRARRRDVRLRPAARAHGHLDDDSARQRRRDHGRLGLRQDDDPAPDRRAAEAAIRPRAGRRANRCPISIATGCFAMRRKLGMLFQFGALFTDMSVYENIAFALREHTDLPEELIRDLVLMKLHAVGLRGAARLMPSELSGGMARRVALARAIALDPMLVMYDEPFAGLDPISLGVVGQLIRQAERRAGHHVGRRDARRLRVAEDRRLPLFRLGRQHHRARHARRSARVGRCVRAPVRRWRSPTVRCRSTTRRAPYRAELLARA